MAHYRGWAGGEDGWGGWKAGGRLNHLLALFGLAMNPRSDSYGPKHA